MKYPIQILLLTCLVLASGCMTGGRRDREEQAARVNFERKNIRSDVERLKVQIADTGTGQEEIYQRLDDLEEAQRKSERLQQERIEKLERALAEQDIAREKDKAEIIDQLSKKMAELVATGAPADEPSEGYQHVVKPGETLSEIAAAYGVRPSVIVRLNKLRNADTIRVGQKLFIPE